LGLSSVFSVILETKKCQNAQIVATLQNRPAVLKKVPVSQP